MAVAARPVVVVAGVVAVPGAGAGLPAVGVGAHAPLRRVAGVGVGRVGVGLGAVELAEHAGDADPAADEQGEAPGPGALLLQGDLVEDVDHPVAQLELALDHVPGGGPVALPLEEEGIHRVVGVHQRDGDLEVVRPRDELGADHGHVHVAAAVGEPVDDELGRDGVAVAEPDEAVGLERVLRRVVGILVGGLGLVLVGVVLLRVVLLRVVGLAVVLLGVVLLAVVTGGERRGSQEQERCAEREQREERSLDEHGSPEGWRAAPRAGDGRAACEVCRRREVTRNRPRADALVGASWGASRAPRGWGTRCCLPRRAPATVAP